jgi:hypothetical protein
MGTDPRPKLGSHQAHAVMRGFGATSVQLKGGKNRAFSRKRRQGNGLEFLLSWFVARRSILN